MKLTHDIRNFFDLTGAVISGGYSGDFPAEIPAENIGIPSAWNNKSSGRLDNAAASLKDGVVTASTGCIIPYTVPDCK